MKLILAADKNWAIGNKGELLCHLPGDLKFFKEKTTGKTVVMGRGTLESLPGKKPLPKRENIVISSNPDYVVEGATVVHSHEELFEYLKGKDSDEVMVMGGGRVYKDLLPYCDTCYITKIYESFDADTWFVNLDEMPEFEVAWESDLQEENGIEYRSFEYRRKK
ncbi:MAG: dihydrofolate reductase [Clostridia bacterium]|nr:dihydrofolate reductase [Clostridia bacterium]